MKSRLIFFNWFVGMVVGSALGALLGSWGKLLIYGVPPQPIEEQPPGGSDFDILWVGSNASFEDALRGLFLGCIGCVVGATVFHFIGLKIKRKLRLERNMELRASFENGSNSGYDMPSNG